MLIKKGKSTVDYAIVSKDLIKFAKHFYVESPTIFSDHSPIILKLEKLEFSNTRNNPNEKEYLFRSINDINIFGRKNTMQHFKIS